MSRTTNCLGEGVLKTFLIISNVIVLLAGLTLLFVGVISLSQRIEYFEDYCEALRRFASGTASFIHQIVYFAPYVLITFGGFLTAISFLGCFGAFTESRVMLGIYASVLALLLLGQLVVGGYCFGRQINVGEQAISAVWTLSVKNCRPLPADPAKTGMGYNLTECPDYKYRFIVQELFQCCGSLNDTDAAWAPNGTSYCKASEGAAGYEDGCYKRAVEDTALYDTTHSRLTVAGFALIVIGVLQLMSIFGALTLYQSIGTARTEEHYDQLRTQKSGKNYAA